MLIITGVKVITGSMKSHSFCVEITTLFLMISSSSLVSSCTSRTFPLFRTKGNEQLVYLPLKLSSSHHSVFVESALRLLRTTSEIFNVCLYGGKWKSNDF